MNFAVRYFLSISSRYVFIVSVLIAIPNECFSSSGKVKGLSLAECKSIFAQLESSSSVDSQIDSVLELIADLSDLEQMPPQNFLEAELREYLNFQVTIHSIQGQRQVTEFLNAFNKFKPVAKTAKRSDKTLKPRKSFRAHLKSARKELLLGMTYASVSILPYFIVFSKTRHPVPSMLAFLVTYFAVEWANLETSKTKEQKSREKRRRLRNSASKTPTREILGWNNQVLKELNESKDIVVARKFEGYIDGVFEKQKIFLVLVKHAKNLELFVIKMSPRSKEVRNILPKSQKRIRVERSQAEESLLSGDGTENLAELIDLEPLAELEDLTPLELSGYFESSPGKNDPLTSSDVDIVEEDLGLIFENEAMETFFNEAKKVIEGTSDESGSGSGLKRIAASLGFVWHDKADAAYRQLSTISKAENVDELKKNSSTFRYFRRTRIYAGHIGLSVGRHYRLIVDWRDGRSRPRIVGILDYHGD